MRKELSVIIPAYNESRKIIETLTEVTGYLRERGYLFEVIVINDGSTDDTAQKVKAFSLDFPQIRLIHHESNAGKGKVVKEGIVLARHPYCLFMDADNSTRIAEWEKFENAFADGFEAVIASRRLPGSRIVKPQPFFRRFFGAGYRALGRFLFGVAVTDFNCGFKAYKTSLAKQIYSQILMNDWTFDLEVLWRLKKEGVRITEVPVTWVHEEKKWSLGLCRTVFRTFFNLFRLRWILFRKPAVP